jgi:uncharacterized protein (UPF0335 family)
MSYPSNSVVGDQLRAFVERVERLEEEIKVLNTDKSEVYAEAKGNGFDVPTIKKIVRMRKMDEASRQEADALLSIYLSALGMATPDGEMPLVHVHEEPTWQAPRVASLGEQKAAFRSGTPISQDFRFENASVYFAAFPSLGRIKIGVSNNVAGRVRSLEKEWGAEAVVIHTQAGNRLVEMAMHDAFDFWRIEGEWFEDCQEFRSKLAKITHDGNAA